MKTSSKPRQNKTKHWAKGIGTDKHKLHAQSLHASALGLLHINYSFPFGILWDTNEWVSNFFALSYTHLFLNGLLCPISVWWFLIYIIIFYFFSLFLTLKCLFYNENRNGVDLGGGRWRINRRRRGRTICNQDIIYYKIIYISINGVNWKKNYDD